MNGIKISVIDPVCNDEKNLVKKIYYLGKIPIIKVKEFEKTETFLFLGLIPFYGKKIKAPVIKDNTFIVWEACSQSHSEVVPGFVKYLLELGYHVSVIVNPDRIKEGLFSKFKDENITLNKLTRKEAKEFFKNNSLDKVKGVLVTTVGKICDCIHYEQAYGAFNNFTDKKKLFFVEHEAKDASDNGTWNSDLITLRKLNYNNEKSVVVNPHYFGEVKNFPKNDIVNFITVGAIQPGRRNMSMIIDAVKKLIEEGIVDFKVTVIGKGNIKHLPKEVRKYFDIKGRLPFKKMYDEIEKSDFFLMSYNEKEHIRYNTTGTSGNFQLIYGFLKPCILLRSFAPVNDLNDNNSILYDNNEDYYFAMKKAIKMSQDEYSAMQNNLKETVLNIEKASRENLKSLIEKGACYDK